MLKKIISVFFAVVIVAGNLSNFSNLFIVLAETETININIAVRTYGNFETAGVNIEFGDEYENIFNAGITADLYYRKQGVSDWTEGHYFVAYDRKHMAASMFYLEKDTVYELRILIKENGKIVYDNLDSLNTVKTKKEFEIPAPLRTVDVSNADELKTAVSEALPGDEIVVAPGIYLGGLKMSNKRGTLENPIVITSISRIGGEMAVIKGQSNISNSCHLIINNIEFTNDGISANSNQLIIGGSSQHITVSNCYIHDAGGSDCYVSAVSLGGNTTVKETHYLLINNVIGDDYLPPHTWYDLKPDWAYYGIHIQEPVGGMITIRNNTVYGHLTAMHTGGTEKESPTFCDPETRSIETDDYLKKWALQEVDIYDNLIYQCNDAVELDGHNINTRVFRNRMGDLNNSPVTTSSAYPGPVFIIENTCTGIRENSVKFNTLSPDNAPEITHNIFVYNNTFIHNPETDSPSIFWLMGGRIKNVTIKNNIYWSTYRAMDNDVITGGNWVFYDNFTHDYNLFYTFEPERDRADGPVFKTFASEDVLDNSAKVFWGFDDYQEKNARINDMHSMYADPLLNLSPHSKYYESSLIYDMSLDKNSPVINAGVYIPGITGEKPNIGANKSTVGGSDGYDKQGSTLMFPAKLLRLAELEKLEELATVKEAETTEEIQEVRETEEVENTENNIYDDIDSNKNNNDDKVLKIIAAVSSAIAIGMIIVLLLSRKNKK